MYAPLHQLNLKDHLESAFNEFCSQHELLPELLLDADASEQELFIIFDGLDELSKQGAAAQAVASQFVREVERAVRDRNQAELHVRVLLNGRPVSIQSNELEFRKEGQVIHLLPFHLTEVEAEGYYDPLKLLTGEHHDQRDDWWRLYGIATGRGYDGLPKELQRDDLREITREPLLNYLVAITVERGELDFSKDVNINQIYRDLLTAVFKRDWEDSQFESIRSLKQHEFERVLEEIALATWHGDGRTTTVKAIIDHCAGSGVAKLLEAFQGGAETGAASLLAAFYFRRHGQVQGEDTFEFTHKSFGEYLVARRIFRAVKKVDKDLRARDEDLDAGTDEVAALEHWIAIFGATSFDQDLLGYINNEIRLAKRDVIVPLHETLVRLLSFELRHGLPIKELSRLGSFDMAREQANNAEVALVVLRSLCAVNAEVVSRIAWPNRTAAGELLCRIRSQRTGNYSMATKFMSRLELESQIIFCCDLFSGDLSFSESPNLGASYSVLSQAKLRSANFQNASFNDASLNDADLQDAGLQDANLRRANLRGADLRGADLEGADLEGADLEGADLEGAILEGAIGLPEGLM